MVEIAATAVPLQGIGGRFTFQDGFQARDGEPGGEVRGLAFREDVAAAEIHLFLGTVEHDSI